VADTAGQISPALDAILGFHIRLAHGAVYRRFNEVFGTLGLTQKQTSVLWVVSDHPGLSQVDIARRLQIDRATMMAIINSLAKRGLMERHASSADRRRQRLHLTPSGAAALSQAQVAIAEHEAWLKSLFTSHEALQLVELLRRVYGEPNRKVRI
jgi:DNA-binding MarR family transcriptional regulator